MLSFPISPEELFARQSPSDDFVWVSYSPLGELWVLFRNGDLRLDTRARVGVGGDIEFSTD
jgi:hypothetical protein